MATFPASPAPSISTAADRQPRTRSISFGDGYTQRSADGINNSGDTYSVFWKSIIEADRATLDNFLAARGGYENFDWTPPNGSSQKFICKKWSWTHTDYNICDFRATFERVFEA